MQNLCTDIANYLLSEGIGTSLGVDVFTDALPDDPIELISITEYGGVPSTYVELSGVSRRVQVLARAPNYEDARKKIWGIYQLLFGGESSILYFTPERWATVRALQTPFKVTFDLRNASSFAFNMAVLTFTDKE